MKLTEQQKCTLDEIYGIARSYTNIAALLNMAVENLVTDVLQEDDDNVVRLTVACKMQYMEDVIRKYEPSKQYINDRLSEIRKTFLKIES